MRRRATNVITVLGVRARPAVWDQGIAGSGPPAGASALTGLCVRFLR
jgi:hypothetical protein